MELPAMGPVHQVWGARASLQVCAARRRYGSLGRVGTTRRLRSPLQTEEETASPVLPTPSSSSSSPAKRVFPKQHTVAGRKMP